MATKRKNTLQKWGAVASFALAFASIASGMIYLTGNLREANGPLFYSLADLLYGPIWGASFVVVVLALQERLGARAPRRINIALLTAVATAVAFVTVACIRAANRQYLLAHPELGLEFGASSVVIGWTTLVAGLIGVGRHLMGWCLVLLGSAGLASGGAKGPISALYIAAGIAAMLAYVFPDLDAVLILLGFVLSIWQGILFLRPNAKQR